ncbi:endonuclease/exonuclease/phosphatase family protein [Antarcticibacterium sp. 1MA-6-2]|uniref:endonuclease/exonuclease/phosphatase family protein n=1 Tax=Antarcticibacterium sp. 1MA-6-2 TaxID=2908210 RepID=UPI001F2119CB|nr:endonuclease/exonuclease/phosphatase family protein [Antarcticibacterium sp. 1MA-6-2]UJH90080.1 endonuclease/exonuclease/phosphatase family protein [Antarcticibacterium sp. 1MA-6-2]
MIKTKISSLIVGYIFVLISCSGSSSSSSKPDLPPDNENTQEAVEETLKIMAYNIHHANPPSNPDLIDLGAIVQVIRNEDPDIIALQEIDVNTGRSGPGNQAQEIALALNMNYFFGRAIDYDGGAYGVAILSKFPLTEEYINRLPTQAGTNGEPRILATAKITTSAGNVIRFGSTHLDAQGEATNRLLQIQKIIELAKDEELPFIIAGDFNAVPGSEVIGILDRHFKRTCNACPFTSSAQNPVRAIDFIAYHHPANKFTTINHGVIDESYASDHLPIVAELKIN